MKFLKLNMTATPVLIQCKSALCYSLLDSIYGSMSVDNISLSDCKLVYTVDSKTEQGPFSIEFADGHHLSLEDAGDFLFQFEQQLVVDLQRAKPELLFLHSAVLELEQKGIALIAASGSGKSTTTWGLLHEGFSYLTDEMSGIQPDTLEIFPFSHAISLKNQPPAPYHLPASILETSRAWNIPVKQLPSPLYQQKLSLDIILYVKYSANITQPEIHPISSAESCSALYTNSLNPLSHPDDGLDAAMHIACNTQAYSLKTGELKSSCRFIKDFLIRQFSSQH